MAQILPFGNTACHPLERVRLVPQLTVLAVERGLAYQVRPRVFLTHIQIAL